MVTNISWHFEFAHCGWPALQLESPIIFITLSYSWNDYALKNGLYDTTEISLRTHNNGHRWNPCYTGQDAGWG